MDKKDTNSIDFDDNTTTTTTTTTTKEISSEQIVNEIKEINSNIENSQNQFESNSNLQNSDLNTNNDSLHTKQSHDNTEKLSLQNVVTDDDTDVQQLRLNLKIQTLNLLTKFNEIENKFNYKEGIELTSSSSSNKSGDNNKSKDGNDIQKLMKEVKSNTSVLNDKFLDMKSKFNNETNMIEIDKENNVYRDSKEDKNLLNENKVDDLNNTSTTDNCEMDQRQQERHRQCQPSTSYSPEEFFNIMKIKNATSPKPTSPPVTMLQQQQQQPIPSTSFNSPRPMNTFSYSSSEEFIKAVMTNNSQQPQQQQQQNISSMNAKAFEDFYKNKLKSISPIINSQSISSTSSSPFKSAIDALPKVYSSNSSISSSSSSITRKVQRQTSLPVGKITSPSSSTTPTSSFMAATTNNFALSQSSSFSSNNVQRNFKNQDIKLKINKVKEKFTKLTMKNNNGVQIQNRNQSKFDNVSSSPSFNLTNMNTNNNKYQNLKVNTTMKQQQQHNQQWQNQNIPNFQVNRNDFQNRIPGNLISSDNYKQQQQQQQQQQQLVLNQFPLKQRNHSTRSVSESESSVISFVSSNNRESIKSNEIVNTNYDYKTQQFQQQQQSRNRTQSTASIDSLNNTTQNVTESSRKKRQRGKRGGQKTSASQEQVENVQNQRHICPLNVNYPHLNAETLIILDLLSLSPEERDAYLIELAKQRGILVEVPKSECPPPPSSSSSPPSISSYELHPTIKNYQNKILFTGKSCTKINDKENKRIRAVLDKITAQLKSGQKKKNKEGPPMCFEDHVNAIVTEGLPEDKIKEFTFPKTLNRDRFSNYFKSPEFTKNLDKFAKKCVDAGLGVIIEGEVRINAKNNDQAFVKYIDGERDAMFSTQLMRKYALHGDIVKAFVRKPPQVQTTTTTASTPTSNNQNQKNSNNGNTVDAANPINSEAVLSTPSSSTLPSSPLATPISTAAPTTSSPTPIEVENLGLAELVADENIEGDDDYDELTEKILPQKSCKGFVIQIVREVNNRKCVGTFLSFRKNSDFISFVPRDMKLPVMRIYKENWPDTFKNNKLDNITDTLYAAQISEWRGEQCIGTILHPIGKCNELESENKAILYQNNLKMEPYDEEFNKMFYGPLIINDNEINKRRDLRKECIFTIDPLTARDLDDALSCKELSNGNYEIGVHISDVSYFLEENTELDKIVSQRTTSVYMVNEVFHMLPKPLCFKCSLLPGEDKLAYSIFWIITPNGDIIDYSITRSVINSCTQFAYEHAQKIIDNPDREFNENDFPQIHNGFTANDIVERIKILNKIATILRENRFENGALKINKPKLSFELDPESGKPINYYIQELKTANFMIEEFMLLANQYVAKFIYDHYPNISILRNHEPPLKNVIRTLKERLAKLGLNFDISSSKSIFESMMNLINSSKYPDAMEICLAHLVSKPMTRARYFCSEQTSTKDDFWHYALSIPIYTHFTSPIRRYPDVLVHRVLNAALQYTPPPSRSQEDLHFIAALCNEMKYNAKLASEDSSNLYFKHYIKSKKTVIFRAAILEIFNYSMEVILIETGHIIRISFPRDGQRKPYKITVDTSKIPYTATLEFINNCDGKSKSDNNDKSENKTNQNDDNDENNDNSNSKENTNNSYPPIELKMFAEISIEVSVGENNKLKGSIAIPPELKKKQQQNDKKKKNKNKKKKDDNDDNLNESKNQENVNNLNDSKDQKNNEELNESKDQENENNAEDESESDLVEEEKEDSGGNEEEENNEEESGGLIKEDSEQENNEEDKTKESCKEEPLTIMEKNEEIKTIEEKEVIKVEEELHKEELSTAMESEVHEEKRKTVEEKPPEEEEKSSEEKELHKEESSTATESEVHEEKRKAVEEKPLDEEEKSSEEKELHKEEPKTLKENEIHEEEGIRVEEGAECKVDERNEEKEHNKEGGESVYKNTTAKKDEKDRKKEKIQPCLTN